MSQTKIIGKHKTLIYTFKGMKCIQYHQTAVVKFDDRYIILNSGGWQTVTTRTRINQTSNQFDLGFIVYQRNFIWYVDFKNPNFDVNIGDSLYWLDKPIDFFDGMIIDRETNNILNKENR